jgi:hypothetical protein
MATRAIIAKLDDNGVKAIYNHSDGYLEHAGRILAEHYRDESKVDELIAQGDISIIDENIGVKIDFNDYKTRYANKQCKFYMRDRGEKYKHAEQLKDETELIEFSNNCDVDFIYMFAYGYWYVYDIHNGEAYNEINKFKELEDELYVLK